MTNVSSPTMIKAVITLVIMAALIAAGFNSNESNESNEVRDKCQYTVYKPCSLFRYTRVRSKDE
jgi:hypothetical protein